MIWPLGFLSGYQRVKQCVHCSVISHHFPFPIGWYGVRSGFLNGVVLYQLGDNLRVKTQSLVRVYPTRNAITEEPLQYQGFGYRLRCLIPSRHCYSKFAVYVRHDQNIFDTATAGSGPEKTMAITCKVPWPQCYALVCVPLDVTFLQDSNPMLNVRTHIRQ